MPGRRWCSKLISSNSHKSFWDGIVIWLSLGVAKTLNLFLFFSVIDQKIAETCGTISFWGHVLAFRENVDKSLAVFLVFFLSFFPQNNGSRFKKGSLLCVPLCSEYQLHKITHLSHLSAPLDYCIFKHHCLLKQFLYLCCTLSAPQDKHTKQGKEQDIIPWLTF